MPLIRFDPVSDKDPDFDGTPGRGTSAATQFIRFLSSHPACPELVQEVLWTPAVDQEDPPIFALLRSLRPQEAFVPKGDADSPFKWLQSMLIACNGMVTDASELLDDDARQRGSLDAFLESIRLCADEGTPEYDDLILMIDGPRTEVEQALDMALTFGSGEKPGQVQIMITEGEEGAAPITFLRIRDLDSTYPLLVWEAASCYRLFYRFEPGYYVQWGYRYPYRALSALHTGKPGGADQIPVTLITHEDGRSVWYHIDNERRFMPVSHMADIHLQNRPASIHLTPLDTQKLQAQKFRITMTLTRSGFTPSASPDSDRRGSTALYHGQRLTERIKSLDLQRARIERELNHLKDLEQSHFMCVFADDQVDAILRLISDYPLSRQRHFLYLPCRTAHDNALLHLLISKEGAGRVDLPGEISHHGDLYIRDRAWHNIGVDVYLPEGYAVRPHIGFENSVQLLTAFESDLPPESLMGQSFILRPAAARGPDAIEKIMVPEHEAVELTEALQYVNAAMETHTLQPAGADLIQVRTTQFERQYHRALNELMNTREILKSQFAIFLEGMDEDLQAALNELAYRKNEMDEYAEARKAMTRYCEDIRALVQQPGNHLFDFMRRETELHRTLASQIGSVDYRFNIQYESFEHQTRQILSRDHDTLKHKLSELLLRIEQDGEALQERTEAIRQELAQYRDIPDRLKQGLDEFKRLEKTVRAYITTVKRVMK